MELLVRDDYELFLKEYPEYKHTEKLDHLRDTDFSRLDDQGHTYLDYTGGGLYARSQLDEHITMLSHGVFGNPHSTNPTSLASEERVEEARQAVLEYFNAGNYYCVFTPNATGALKIIGESFPFGEKSHFLLPFDNHNSVNGIREYARKKGAEYVYTPVNIEDLRFNPQALEKQLAAFTSDYHKLFAYPAQSNVSGVKHDLAWIKKAQNQGWNVLLDASAYVPTNRLDLVDHQPDFVSMSFYKMFGYPTGLGALLIHKDSYHLLEKPWFAGGTVTLASVMADGFILDKAHTRFEDGTINYLGIPAIKMGLDYLTEAGIDRINKRVSILTSYLIKELMEIRHGNGHPVVRIFGPGDEEGRGGTIILNLFDQDGEIVPFQEVEQRANEMNFSIRTGCFCNPGIDEISNVLNRGELQDFFDSHKDGSYQEMQESLEKMRGAIRISLGIVSNFADVRRFLRFLSYYQQ